MKRKKKRRSAGGKKGTRVWAYPAEFRLKVVRLFLEEAYSASLLSEQFNISSHSINRWVNAYRRDGVQGLEPKPRPGGNTRVTPKSVSE